MMTVGSVGYLGSAPATAVLGLASVFLYVLPAFVFLVPVSLVAAELASGWPEGVFNWVCEGISAPMGLLAVWCQFAQTIFYYPALLAFVGSTLAYVIDQRLASNGVYTAAVIIVLFWGGVLVSSRGISLVAELSSSAAVRLRRAQPDHPRGYRAPALGLLCLVGGLSSVTAFVIGFVSPPQLAHTSPLLYAALIAAGILVLGVGPPLLLHRFRKPAWKATGLTEGAQP
jgi:glutamate:GABA antiporter